MERVYITGIVIAAIVLLGFIVAGTLPSETVCTEMGCPCESDGERPCNDCSLLEPVFTLGIVNVVEVCHGTEILTCENSIKIDERIDWEGCEYKWYFLGVF